MVTSPTPVLTHVPSHMLDTYIKADTHICNCLFIPQWDMRSTALYFNMQETLTLFSINTRTQVLLNPAPWSSSVLCYCYVAKSSLSTTNCTNTRRSDLPKKDTALLYSKLPKFKAIWQEYAMLFKAYFSPKICSLLKFNSQPYALRVLIWLNVHI